MEDLEINYAREMAIDYAIKVLGSEMYMQPKVVIEMAEAILQFITKTSE